MKNQTSIKIGYSFTEVGDIVVLTQYDKLGKLVYISWCYGSIFETSVNDMLKIANCIDEYNTIIEAGYSTNHHKIIFRMKQVYDLLYTDSESIESDIKYYFK